MYEATFRIEGAGAYAAATAGTPTRVELWCNEHCDLLHVSGPDGAAVLDQVREQVGVQERIEEGEELLAITADCLKKQDAENVERYLARRNCLLVPPLEYAQGAKFCRVLALDASALTALYRDLTEEYAVTVETKREVRSVAPDAPILSREDLLPTLTARQRQVLRTAYELGYYEIPRGTTTADVAARVGVERRTAEEHLRRAENKLMAALVEYVG